MQSRGNMQQSRENDKAEETCKEALTQLGTFLEDSAGKCEEAVMQTLSKGIKDGGASCQLSAYHGTTLTGGMISSMCSIVDGEYLFMRLFSALFLVVEDNDDIKMDDETWRDLKRLMRMWTWFAKLLKVLRNPKVLTERDAVFGERVPLLRSRVAGFIRGRPVREAPHVGGPRTAGLPSSKMRVHAIRRARRGDACGAESVQAHLVPSA